MRIQAYVLSCAERGAILQRTLESLADAGWGATPDVILDRATEPTPIERIRANWHRMIGIAAASDADYVMLLEDDLVFGKRFARNLHAWPLLKSVPKAGAFYGSLYNPGHPYIIRRPSECYLVADARWVWGSQALLLSPGTARFIHANWCGADGNPDMRMPRLARSITPIYYHLPSLVDHASVPTTWGGFEHHAVDFDPDWCTPGMYAAGSESGAIL